MYKDVKEKFSWKTMKKVLAVVVSICLVVTIVQFPSVTAYAEDGSVSQDYENALEEDTSAIEENTEVETEEAAEDENTEAETKETVDNQSVADAEEDENADDVVTYSNEEEGIAVAADTGVTITADMIELIANATASPDSASVKPVIRVKTSDGKVLKENVDYTCSVYLDGDSNTEGTKGDVSVCAKGSTTVIKRIPFTVCKDFSSELDILETLPAQTYTGSPITLSSLYTIHRGSSLTADDLNVEYIDNINAGTATVTISPKTSTEFGGKIEKTFAIDKVDISTLPESAFSYDEKVVYNPVASVTPPTVTVSYNGNILSEGTDYQVTTSGFDKAGDATITLDADNGTNDVKNYTGKKNLSVTVDPCPLSGTNITVKLDGTKYTYTGEIITPNTIIMKYGDTIIYDKNGEGKSLFTVNYEGNTTNYGTVKGIIKPAEGNKNYTGSKTFTYQITKINMDSVEVEHDPQKNYDNVELVQYANDNGLLAVKELSGSTEVKLDDEVTLKYKGKKLSADDYEVSYQYNTVVSKTNRLAEVTFSAKDESNYTGSITKKFLIVENISGWGDECIPTDRRELSYQNGTPVVFEDGDLVIKNKDKEPLVQGDSTNDDADYRVVYSNNKAVGTATYQVVGNGKLTSRGCFVGSASRTFEIKPKNLNDKDITVDPITVKYVDGETVTLEYKNIHVTYLGKELVGGITGCDFHIERYVDNDKCGIAKVILKGDGNYTGEREVEFKIQGKDIETGYSVEVSECTYTGGPVIPTIKVTKDDDGTELDKGNYKISYWKEENGEKKKVTNLTEAGEYIVEISGDNNKKYTGTIEKNFTISRRDINDKNITHAIKEPSKIVYTGKGIEADFNIYHDLSGSTVVLVKDKDYEVTYQNNINAGKAIATVQGIGNYTGERTIEFSIAKKNLGDGEVIIDPIDVQPYNDGEEVKPEPSVTYGGHKLKKDTDFKYTYSANREIGTNTAKLTIVPADEENCNFTGFRTVSFSIQASIEDANCIVSLEKPDVGSNGYYYTGSAIKPKVQVVDNKTGKKLTLGTDYNVEYSGNINVGGSPSVVVRGTGKYIGLKRISFEIKPVPMENVDVELASNTFTYTGSQITPAILSIKYGNYKLASNDTYSVSYGENIDTSSDGKIIIEPTGENRNFTGTKEVAFTIAPKDISKSKTAFANDIVLSADGETVASIPTQGYTGKNITPDIELQYKVPATDTKKLVLNTDYVVSIEKGIGPGIATMKFFGRGNYTGTVEQNFTIARDISGATVEGIEETYHYTGNEIKVEDNLKVSLFGSDVDPYQLDAADYNVTYKDNVNAGTATVTISGNEKNFYTGSIEKTFKIKANFGDDSTTVAEIEDVPRDPSDNSGKTYHPEALEITCGGNTFNNAESNENYDVTYENDTKIGTATLTLTGKGEFYEGTKTVTYDIVPANSTFKVVYKNGDKITDQKFCGKEITFDPESEDFPFTVYYVEEDGTTERELVYGTDYKLEYSNNVNANVTLQDDGSFQDAATKAEVVIRGIGKYKHGNMKTCTFTILPLLLDDLVINDSKFLPEGSEDVIGPREYTGKTVTPSEIQIQNVDAETGDVIYTLTKEDYTLTPETELTGEDGSVVKTYTYEAGSKTACVTIKGNGQNCIGTKTIEYDIAQMDITKTKITTTAQEYTGYALQPDVQVVNPLNDNAVLVLNEDYFLEYENNVDAGVATVRVVANDTDGHNFKGSAEATFKINPIAITASSITVDEIPSQDYSGAGVTPDVAISYTDPQGVVNALHEGTDYELSYANNTKAGTARVTIAGKGNFTGTTAKPFTINPCNIGEENTNITIDPIENQPYTGSNITPTVTVKDRDYQMKSGVDYTVTYSNNKEIGKATATVVGKGNYTGSRSVTFQIASDISKAEIGNGVAKEYKYTGTKICPVPSNVHIGATNLVAGTDYTVSYEDNLNIGTAKMTLTGKGAYGGTLEQSFTIVRKDISDSDVTMTGYTDKVTYTGSKVTLPIVLKYGTITLKEGTDYTITYANNAAVGTASFEIVGLGNYTGTITKKFALVIRSVSDSDVKIAGISSTYTYNGSAIAPVPTLTNSDGKMTKGVDYTITYKNNKAVGVATMTIKGIGKYQGTRDVTYKIIRKSIANCTVSKVGTQIYTGKDIKPKVTVKDGKKELVKGTDYTIMYSNNRKPGTGSITIAGKGNYTVSKTIRFDIRPGGTKGLKVSKTSKNSIELKWSAQGTVTGYEIYRADSNGKYKRIARVKGKKYTNKKLKAGKKYKYKVRAYLTTKKETYYSKFSDVVTGKTKK